MKSASVRFVAGGAIVAFVFVASGCIFVTSRKSGSEEVELTKAQAQCLSARVELERINLEREKAGLPRVHVGGDDHTVTITEPGSPTPPKQ